MIVQYGATLDQLGPRLISSGPLAERVDKANQAARNCALDRLAAFIPEAALSQLGGYFTKPAIFSATSAATPRPGTLPELIEAICTRTHDFSIGEKARGMQIGILPLQEPITLDQLGERVEPDSTLCRPTPEGLMAAARVNASIELRVFDRQFESWALVADDLAAICGADIFMKLFIAGGECSVNDWHRDTSDVLVTVLDGSKRFEVGASDARDDAPISELDVLMKPGDVLLLPRGRLHNATPTGEISALLSIGIMRLADWAYRSTSPTHLNLHNPRSPSLYRRALRAHCAPLRILPGPDVLVATRLPGGLALVENDSEPQLLAAGVLCKPPSANRDILLELHGMTAASPAELARCCGYGSDQVLVALNGWAQIGWIRAA